MTLTQLFSFSFSRPRWGVPPGFLSFSPLFALSCSLNRAARPSPNRCVPCRQPLPVPLSTLQRPTREPPFFSSRAARRQENAEEIKRNDCAQNKSGADSDSEAIGVRGGKGSVDDDNVVEERGKKTARGGRQSVRRTRTKQNAHSSTARKRSAVGQELLAARDDGPAETVSRELRVRHGVARRPDRPLSKAASPPVRPRVCVREIAAALVR